MKQVIIDVREPIEFQSGHVEGALNLPPAQLMNEELVKEKVPQDAEVIVYCRTGSRSNVAIHMLKSYGYTNLTNGVNKEQVEARYLK